MTRFNLSTLAAVTLPLLLSVGSGRAANIIYTDGFEGATFNSFWTANQQLGTVSLSTDQARSGTQSARLRIPGEADHDSEVMAITVTK